MNRFAKIYETIWTDDKFSRLSADAKLLYIYLASCKDGNSLGLFKISLGTIVDDFGTRDDEEVVYDRKRIRELLKELEDSSLIRYRERWIMFNKWLRWNPPQGTLMAKRLASNLGEVILQDPPAELVAYFLSTVQGALYDLEGSNKDGSKFRYYDIFKKAFPLKAVSDHLGGSVEVVKACLEGQVESVLERLNGTSSDSEEKNAVGTPLERRSNAVRTPLWKEKEKEKEKKKEKDSFSLSYKSVNSAYELSVLCTDNQRGFVSPAVVETSIKEHPMLDWNRVRLLLQSETIAQPLAPSQQVIDAFFTNFIKDQTKETK